MATVATLLVLASRCDARALKRQNPMNRWIRAVRAVVLRLRAKQRMYSGLQRGFGRLAAQHCVSSFMSSQVMGPQLSLLCCVEPPPSQRGGGPKKPIDLQIEVGGLRWTPCDAAAASAATKASVP